jgi:hypothetical protein
MLRTEYGEMLRTELGEILGLLFDEIRDVRNELRQLRALFWKAGSRSLSAVWFGPGSPLKCQSTINN